MENQVTIQVGNIESKIVDILPIPVIMNISSKTSYYISGAQFSQYAKSGQWDGTKKLFSQKNQSFPTGLLNRVLKCLYAFGYKVNFEDTRVKPVSKKPIKLKGIKLRDYQEDCINELSKKSRGIIQVGTGGGKSILVSGLISRLNVKTLIIVPTSGLLYQTAEVLSKVTGKKIGMIGDSLKDIRDITVSTFQSLVESEDTKKRKYDAEKGRWSTVDAKKITVRSDLADYLASVECVIVDEAHHVSASSIQQILLNCPNAYYRYGCSATPFHDNDEDVLIEAACGRLLKVYSASFLIKEGWLSKPTIHLIPFKQEKGKSGKKYAELYNEKIVNNNKRNKLLLDIISTRADMGDSVLVSVRYLEHGDIIYKELEKKYNKDVVFVNSKMPTKELNETLQKLSNKEIKIVIGTSLVNEGVNMPSLNTLVLAGTPKSKIATMQLVGRVLRKTDTKSTVDVYDIQDYNAKYFTSASVERLHIYTSEPEFILKEEKINV